MKNEFPVNTPGSGPGSAFVRLAQRLKPFRFAAGVGTLMVGSAFALMVNTSGPRPSATADDHEHGQDTELRGERQLAEPLASTSPSAERGEDVAGGEISSIDGQGSGLAGPDGQGDAHDPADPSHKDKPVLDRIQASLPLTMPGPGGSGQTESSSGGSSMPGSVPYVGAAGVGGPGSGGTASGGDFFVAGSSRTKSADADTQPPQTLAPPKLPQFPGNSSGPDDSTNGGPDQPRTPASHGGPQQGFTGHGPDDLPGGKGVEPPEPMSVPEPGTLILVGSGAAGLLFRHLRRRKHNVR